MGGGAADWMWVCPLPRDHEVEKEPLIARFSCYSSSRPFLTPQ